jgi:hypothetical protein
MKKGVFVSTFNTVKKVECRAAVPAATAPVGLVDILTFVKSASVFH